MPVKFVNFLKSKLIFNIIYCFWMFENKLFSKRCFNARFSTCYFHMMRKILADFQICISVPLRTWPFCEKNLPWRHVEIRFAYFLKNYVKTIFVSTIETTVVNLTKSYNFNWWYGLKVDSKSKSLAISQYRETLYQKSLLFNPLVPGVH